MPDFFAPLRGSGGLAGRYIQLDGLHPNEKGVDLVIGALGPQVLELVGRVGG